jgi:capsular exopolysaccharide synthesis family protein
MMKGDPEKEPQSLIRLDASAPYPKLYADYDHRWEREERTQQIVAGYWRAVRRYLWLVIGLVALAAAATAIYMARQPDLYLARARVEIGSEEDSTLSLSPTGGPVVINRSSDPTYFSTQLQILTGSQLLRRVVRTLDLEHNPEFLRPRAVRDLSPWLNLRRMLMLGAGQEKSAGQRGTRGQMPLPSEIAPATESQDDFDVAMRLDPYVRTIASSLKVDPVKEIRLPVKETRLIDISFRHPDPYVAATVVNTIAETYKLSNLEKRTSARATTSQFLQRRIAELQAQIRAGEAQLLAYSKSHQILSLDPSQNTVVERLAGLNRQLLDAENERKLAEAAYLASLEPGAAEAMVEKEDGISVAALNKLTELRQRRAQLLVEATEEMPEVKEVNEQIAELERQINEARARAKDVMLTNLRTRYRQALAREEALRQAFDEQRGETLTQNEAAINYRIIQQEIETNKSLLDNLLQRAKENGMAMAGVANNIHIVEYAFPPNRPIGPARLQAVGLAIVLGLAVGIGLAIFLDYLDDSLQSAEEVERELHLPALAAIPTVSSRRSLSKAVALQTDGTAHPELLVGDGGESGLAETYRQLRTSVLLSTPGHAPKTLLVASSAEAEGKSTVAVNVALILAQTGAQVLLIDADMRRPKLHELFGLKNERGLSTLLSSEIRNGDAFKCIHDSARGVQVLTSGPLAPHPAELLGSDQMRALLEELRARFDYIIVDSPPIAYFTDGVVVATLVDGVMLVVRRGKSSRRIVRRTQKILHDVGARIFGVVFNHAGMPSDAAYYRYNR